MKPETLLRLENETQSSIEISHVHKGIRFIHRLMSEGVPLSSIDVNDWNANLSPGIYVTIPYGGRKGGSYRIYHRWSKKDIKSALKFYKSMA